MQLLAHRRLVPHDGDVRRPGRPFLVEHRSVRRQLPVDGERLGRLLPSRVDISGHADGQAHRHARGWPARFFGRLADRGDDVVGDCRRPRHPGDCAVGHRSCELQHHWRQSGQEHGRRLHALHVERAERVGLQGLAGEGDLLAPQGRKEGGQVLAHVPGRLVERVPEGALDHDLMREADAEDQTVTDGSLHREGLPREHQRMSRVGRDDGGA